MWVNFLESSSFKTGNCAFDKRELIPKGMDKSSHPTVNRTQIPKMYKRYYLTKLTLKVTPILLNTHRFYYKVSINLC